MSRNAAITVVVILILVVAGWFLTRPKQSAPIPTPVAKQTQAPDSTQSASPSSATEGAIIKEGKNVTITKTGFSPKDITIAVGETVIWANSDTADHTVNSAPHPTHTSYPPLNLDTIKPGEKKSLAFPKPGVYKYHDHLNPSLFGSVTVQ